MDGPLCEDRCYYGCSYSFSSIPWKLFWVFSNSFSTSKLVLDIPVLHDDLLLKAAMVYVLESNHELGMHTVTKKYFFLFWNKHFYCVREDANISPPLSASEGKKARSIDQSKNRINHRIAPNESCFEYFLIRFLLPSWYWIPVLHDDLLLSCNVVCVQY